MSSLHIMIDSSIDGNPDCGKAIAFWLAYWNDYKIEPYRSGFVYSNYQCPQRIFYEGIIQALNTCCCIMNGRNDEIIVFGDNQPVIHQLQGTRGVDELVDYYKQVKRIEKEYSYFSIKYEYLNDNDPMYKIVDICSKEYRKEMTKKFDELIN